MIFTRGTLTLMEKRLMILAVVISAAAVVLAMDPGRYVFKNVDVGGHELRMRILGKGAPTVVFEAGGSTAAGGPLEAWERVQPAVSKFATTVSYDRAGIGWSKPGPKPRDARQVARELHTALQNAHVPSPYVLVGHSFGGPLNRVFADMYPNEVAGMLLLDPTQEEFMEWEHAYEVREGKATERQDEEWKDIVATLAQAHESKVPTNIPVILITAMGPRVLPKFVTEKQKKELNTLRPMWLKFHQEWVDKIPNARHVVTEESGHGIPFEDPALVIETIRKMVDQIKGRSEGVALK